MPQVKENQTVSGIIQELGTTPEEFLKANPSFAAKGGKNDYKGLTGDIQIGQEYVVPTTTSITPIPGSGTYIEDLAKLADLGVKVGAAKEAGYSGTDEIKYDSTGKVIPKTPSEVVGTSDALREKEKQAEIDRIKKELEPDITKPTLYKSVDDYKKLREEQGVVKDEEELTSIQNEANLIKEDIRKFKSTAGEAVPETGRIGMMSEVERNANFRLEGLAIRENAVLNRVNTKNAYINKMVELGQSDYTTAKNEYDNAYNKNYQAVQLFNSQESDEKKDAITGITTISNLLKDKNINFNNLDPAIKTQLDTLSLQAGLPTGLIQQAVLSAPNDEVKTVNSRTDESGNSYFDILRVKPNGEMYVQKVYRGSEETTTSESKYKKTQDWKNARQFIEDNPNAKAEELETGLREHTTTLSDADIKSLLSEKGLTKTEPTKLTRQSVSSLYGIPDNNEQSSFLGIKWGKTNSEKLDNIMATIKKYQDVGYSDTDILKLIKE